MDLFQAFRAAQDNTVLGDFDDTDAVYAAMEVSKQLLSVAHDLAQHAVQIQGFESEADRIEVAKRQVILIGELLEQLQAVMMGAQP